MQIPILQEDIGAIQIQIPETHALILIGEVTPVVDLLVDFQINLLAVALIVVEVSTVVAPEWVERLVVEVLVDRIRGEETISQQRQS